METKNVVKSTTIWVNVIAAGAMFVQRQYGYVIPPEVQLLILAGINAIVRLFTKRAVKFTK